jgi:signal transduction histidine kinase
MMRPSSLAFRLTVSAAIVSLVLLVSAGLLLSYLFQVTIERNFDARLQAVLDGLLANVEVNEDGAPVVLGAIADTRFKLPLSGWYWQVSALDGRPDHELVSESLLDNRLRPADLQNRARDEAGLARFYLIDQSGTQLRGIEQRFTLFGGKQQFSFLLAGNFDELKREIAAFTQTLWAVLAVLGMGLLAAILVQVRFGLRPLRRLQDELAAIRSGAEERLAGRYPVEIEPVSNELNLLLQSNTEIVDRARTQVGNLAHALKTPLSVLSNEARIHGGELGHKVGEQAAIMSEQVSMYLDRARRAARASSLGAATDVSDVVDALARTLKRIHLERGMDCEVACPTGLKFRGERQDLEEMLGNLLDNAFKWARKRIDVEVTSVRGDDQGRHWLNVKVGDDGPGLPAEKRAEALKRGQRIDETKPGSGLGLNIVNETAMMYGGSVSLDRSPLGGLLATLRLPAV